MKKNIVLLFFSLIGASLLAQDVADERIYLSERNAAQKIMRFKANPKTNTYDVSHYRLEFQVDPTTHYIKGIVTTTFTAKQNMESLSFAFGSNMTVNTVRRKGRALSFSLNADDELTIDFSSPIPEGETASVEISYEGSPASYGFDSFATDTHNGAPVLWTLSEPYGAKAWWPCKQNLTDKADSIDVFITTPKAYTAVSNGILEEEKTNGNFKTAHWDHDYPIPAYLIAIAVSNYQKYTRTAGSETQTFPVVNYVYPEDYVYLKAKTKVTVDLMNFFESKFGPYPYAEEKYGHVQFGWGGGMEHATISFMGGFSRGLIAHELGHQWFGDKVTCASWQDIWLNEGFAGYMEGLVIEEFDGQAAFLQWRKNTVNSVIAKPGGSVFVPAEDTLNVNRVFNGRLSYEKSAMVLHMLRKKLGDLKFFKAVRNYLSDPLLAYGFAQTSDLKDHFEAVSHSDLTEFFQDWIYGEGFPTYAVTWHQNPNGEVVLRFSQTQSHPAVAFFEASVPVLLHGQNGEEKLVVFENTVEGEVFKETVSFEVRAVEIDPYVHLISGENKVQLGVTSYRISNQIQVFPNPVKNELHIKMPEEVNIKVYLIFDIRGRCVKQQKFFSPSVISTTQLQPGLYFLKLKTSSGQFVKKIMKK